jgi:hypothetical protein
MRTESNWQDDTRFVVLPKPAIDERSRNVHLENPFFVSQVSVLFETFKIISSKAE